VLNVGSKMWAVGEGYIEVEIMVYFSDREPAGPYVYSLPARRTLHTRFNDMHVPESIPIGVGYSSTIEASVRIVVQHTRLDSRQTENALMTTIAYASPDAG